MTVYNKVVSGVQCSLYVPARDCIYTRSKTLFLTTMLEYLFILDSLVMTVNNKISIFITIFQLSYDSIQISYRLHSVLDYLNQLMISIYKRCYPTFSIGRCSSDSKQ